MREPALGDTVAMEEEAGESGIEVTEDAGREGLQQLLDLWWQLLPVVGLVPDDPETVPHQSHVIAAELANVVGEIGMKPVMTA